MAALTLMGQSIRGDPNGFRVYIAKITFTTLIDHFTSLYAARHWF